MIVRLCNKSPHVLYQTPDDDCSVAEPAIGVSLDAGGMIIMEQNDDTILLNSKSVPELCKLLKRLAQEGAR